MRSDPHIQQRIKAACELLETQSISVATFEQLRAIIKGIHPGVDQKLTICSDALQKLNKIQSGDVIALSADALPEKTDEQKKKKKAIIFFINSLRDLESEIKRVEKEFSQNNNQPTQWGRIISGAKGPIGIVTILAVVIVGFTLFQNQPTKQVPIVQKTSNTQVIVYQGKQIPLNALKTSIGPECDKAYHYHALNHESVKALDGTVVYDPGRCGFGKVEEVKVIEVE